MLAHVLISVHPKPNNPYRPNGLYLYGGQEEFTNTEEAYIMLKFLPSIEVLTESSKRIAEQISFGRNHRRPWNRMFTQNTERKPKKKHL